MKEDEGGGCQIEPSPEKTNLKKSSLIRLKPLLIGDYVYDPVVEF